jgi:hypothetical protein
LPAPVPAAATAACGGWRMCCAMKSSRVMSEVPQPSCK